MKRNKNKCFVKSCQAKPTLKVTPDNNPLDYVYCCDSHYVDSFTDCEGHWVHKI